MTILEIIFLLGCFGLIFVVFVALWQIAILKIVKEDV